jgi:hypothetical protein
MRRQMFDQAIQMLEHPSEENAEPYSWREKLLFARLELLFDALTSFGRKLVS